MTMREKCLFPAFLPISHPESLSLWTLSIVRCLDSTKRKTNAKLRKMDLFPSPSKTVGIYLNNSAQNQLIKAALHALEYTQ